MDAKRSISEVGHARNAANFNAMVNILTEMGDMYNPANGLIDMVKLNIMNGAIDACVGELSADFPLFREAVADRGERFAGLPRFATRVKNAYYAMETSEGMRANLNGMVLKLRGAAKSKKRVSETDNDEHISNSHRSYDNMAATLRELVDFVGTSTVYASNDPELSPEGLRGYYEDMKGLNNTVSVRGATIITGRKKRNDLMYNGDPNMFEVVKLVKNYLKSLHGAEEYYKAVVRLKFKAIPK